MTLLSRGKFFYSSQVQKKCTLMSKKNCGARLMYYIRKFADSADQPIAHIFGQQGKTTVNVFGNRVSPIKFL